MTHLEHIKHELRQLQNPVLLVDGNAAVKPEAVRYLAELVRELVEYIERNEK